jgi:hypothetical protein
MSNPSAAGGTPAGFTPGPSGETGGNPQSPFSIPEPAPARQSDHVPSPQSLRRRGSAWLGQDADGNSISGTGDVYSQATEGSPPSSPSGRLTFRSPTSGRAVLSRNASESDLVVDASGNVVSDLGSLLNAGMVEEDGQGGYRLVGQAAGTEGGQQQVDPQDAAREATERAAQEAAARAVPFTDSNAEGLVQYLQSNHAALFANLSEVMSDLSLSGILPSHLLESAAQDLGMTTEDARGVVAHVAQAFRQQYQQRLAETGIDIESFERWAKDSKTDKQTKEILQRAIKAHAQDRDPASYDLAISRYLAEFAGKYPHEFMRQIGDNPNFKFDRTTNTVLVNVPGLGTTDAATAFRQGWATTRRSASRDARGRYSQQNVDPYPPSAFTPGQRG